MNNNRVAASSPPGNQLIHDNTADTLVAIQSVISALHMAFNALHESPLYGSHQKRSLVGITYILDGVSKALDYEIDRHGGDIARVEDSSNG